MSQHSNMEQTVGGFKRTIHFSPAWDRRDPDPSKNYGIHGADMRFVVARDGLAITFLLYTNWMLPQNRREGNCGEYCINTPMPADIGYHSDRPVSDWQTEPSEAECEYLGVPCYYDGSGLQADGVFDVLVRDGIDALWALLEGRHAEMMAGRRERSDADTQDD